MARPARYKDCEHCGQSFKLTHGYNQFCSRKCTSERTFPKPGDKFNRFTVIAILPLSEGSSQRYANVMCDCGTPKRVQVAALKNGTTKSCGCLRDETSWLNGKRAKTHGMCTTPEYYAFHGAKDRCRNKHNARYSDWGGRGIEFRFESFEQFFDEVGTKPTPKHTLDRIDNNGHYEPGNVRWSTYLEQNRNQRPKCSREVKMLILCLVVLLSSGRNEQRPP